MIFTIRRFGWLLVLLPACGGSMASDSYQSPFFNQQGVPSADLAALLKATNVSCLSSRGDVVTKTQQTWLRPAGKERFELSDTYAQRMPELKPLFQRLGLIDDVLPQKQQYDYGLVHGATVLGMRGRVAFLAKLWQAGVRFKTLVLLVGERDLYPAHEPLSSFTSHQDRCPMQPGWQQNTLPATEDQAMCVIYDHMVLPEGMRKVPMVLVNAKKQQLPDGKWRRPNTKDTIDAWLKLGPPAGSCLAVSSQPMVGYQDLTVRCLLPQGFTLETAGFAMPAEFESAVLCLDSLARWLYQEQEYIKQFASA